MATYLGSICEKHPDSRGERYLANRQCLLCCKEQAKARRSKPELKKLLSVQSAQRCKRKKEKDLEFKQKLYQKSVEYQRKRYKEDPEFRSFVAAKTAFRRSSKMQRTPVWSDLAKIRQIYAQARKVGMVVDHIIPLQGKLVSGLHVPENLQIIPAIENMKKGNRFTIETGV
jgi:hypothetical protein